MVQFNWYSVNIIANNDTIFLKENVIKTGDIILNGYFVTNNDTNEIIGFYEKNWWSNNLLLSTNAGNYTFYQESTSQTSEIVINQINETTNKVYTNNITNYNPYNKNPIQITYSYNNIFKNKWKQFDIYGTCIKNMSFFQYTPNTEYTSIKFSANNLNDEMNSNIGQLSYGVKINNERYNYTISVTFNIQSSNWQINVSQPIPYVQWNCQNSATVTIETNRGNTETFTTTSEGTGSDAQSSQIAAYNAIQTNINNFLLKNPNTIKNETNINETLPIKQIILRDKYMSDFDGTLMKGYIDGVSSYHMSVSEYLYSINMVNSTLYPTWSVYSSVQNKKLAQNDTTAFLMPFEIYNSDQDQYIEQYWETTLQYYFIDYTRELLMIYILQGYQVCIISGSPYIYTKYLTKYLPVQNIIGPEPNGLITYGVGKVTYAKQYTGSQLNSLAGYVGDTWNNDGLLLSTAKNYNINSDCQFILHGQQNNSDTIANLEKYGIIQIYAY